MKPKHIFTVLTLVLITALEVLFLNSDPNNIQSNSEDWVLLEKSDVTTAELGTSSPDETSNTANETYAIFTNDQLGISFQYPTTYKPNTELEIDGPCVTDTTTASQSYPEGVEVLKMLKDKHCLSYRITLESNNKLMPDVTIKVANPWAVERELDLLRDLAKLPRYLFPPTETVVTSDELKKLNLDFAIEKNVLVEIESRIHDYTPIQPHYYYRFFISEKNLGFLIGYQTTYGDEKSQQVVDDIVASIELI